MIISDYICHATKEIRRSDQPCFYSTKIAANRAPRTAATAPIVRPAAAPGNGIVEPVEPLGETGFVPPEAVPEGAGAVAAAEVVGNGGVIEAAGLLVVAALVSSGVELATEGVDTTVLEVGVSTAAVVEAGAAAAVAAHPQTASADDSTAKPVTAPQPSKTHGRADLTIAADLLPHRHL